MILVTGQELVLTPEKVVVSYTIAGIGQRLVAAVTDLFIILAVILGGAVLMGFLSAFFGGFSTAVYVFTVSILPFAYFPLFMIFNNGQSLGKMMMGLRVMMADGTPITPSAAIYRTLLLPADMLPGIPLVGFILSFITERSQRLGDIAAGTMVVKAPNLRFHFNPAPHHVGVHPVEYSIGELQGMTLEEYFALKRLCDRFPDLPITEQIQSIEEIWKPFAERQKIPSIPQVHPLYQIEAVVMKFGRLKKLV